MAVVITIGGNVVVGAGAAVVNDIESGLTVAGVPARQAKAGRTRRSPGCAK